MLNRTGGTASVEIGTSPAATPVRRVVRRDRMPRWTSSTSKLLSSAISLVEFTPTRMWQQGNALRESGGSQRMFATDLSRLALRIDECGDGDPSAASERLEVLQGIPLLNETVEAEMLAELLIDRKAVPASEPRDALHIATAAVNGVQFISTWNFKHILNPHLQAQIASVCRDAGFIPPVICTPEQLKATENDS